ncbi:MAG: hypothetical protein Q7S58_03535 [Candidatus Binatus sp.]|nr:hypothetical protein [Candidatus Binatus sp.]MDO8431462.1 hypothetical protein [Candidatus Binatus sp.]
MTADRDPTLDSILTATSKEAWQVIFDRLWEIFSAPLTSQHAEQEVADRESKVSEIELLLSSSAWELWREFESSVPRTAQSVIDFWNSATSGKAVLILDGLSLRESPWLLQEAERRGYHIQQAGARGSEIPSETRPFARALGFGQRSSIENNGAGMAHLLPGARTESLNVAWDYCHDWIASAPAIVLWHHWPAGQALTNLHQRAADLYIAGVFHNRGARIFCLEVERSRAANETLLALAVQEHLVVLGGAFFFELEIPRVGSLDGRDSDVDGAGELIGAKDLELFASGDKPRQPLGIVEKFPHPLARGGKSGFTSQLHRRFM